jgi:hypothetical protein
MHPHYPLTVSVKVIQIFIRFSMKALIVKSTTITRMLGHFCTLLLGMTAKQQQRVKDLPLLTAQELINYWWIGMIPS